MLRSFFVLVAVLAASGCNPFAPTLAIADLLDRPDAFETRPGGLGVRDSVRYVIHVSVDGLRPDAVERLGMELPAFVRLRTESAYTHNARTDPDYRITLPNHTTQLTGRGVVGSTGHEWTVNLDPAPGVTLHSNKGSYVPSVFDQAHDAGLRTAAYVSKSKFSLFDVSYDARHGAPDTTGADDGRAKIDVFDYESDTERLVADFVRDTRAQPANYTFVHLRNPDAAGHIFRWSVRRGSRYLDAVQAADARVGEILDLVESDPRLRGRTIVIVTADHGGSGNHHWRERRLHYTVPFYVWGAGIPIADLYDLNADRYKDPGTENVGYDAEKQPIRNGDAANLALAILGLDSVPGSTITPGDPLILRAAPPDTTAGG